MAYVGRGMFLGCAYMAINVQRNESRNVRLVPVTNHTTRVPHATAVVGQSVFPGQTKKAIRRMSCPVLS
jgi:hypothetical protein